jgi:hypothetical protein
MAKLLLLDPFLTLLPVPVLETYSQTRSHHRGGQGDDAPRYLPSNRLNNNRFGDNKIPGHCKVDDLAGHRLGEIITFREGLHRVFFR